jgi:hypothetical protein
MGDRRSHHVSSGIRKEYFWPYDFPEFDMRELRFKRAAFDEFIELAEEGFPTVIRVAALVQENLEDIANYAHFVRY